MEVKNCRICESKALVPIISLGKQYITNFIDDEKEQGERIPLDLVLCSECKTLQLKHNVPPESMWSEQYWYKSGISSTIRDDLKDLVEKAKSLRALKSKDIVVDIGCNDGTLLSFYGKEGFILVGFEPSKNVAKEAAEKGHTVINSFFNAEDFKKKFGTHKAKIITAISMFYDLEDPNKFLEDIVSCLDKDGLFVIQQNYLLTMLEQNAFDNICHEHREYYSFTSLKNLLEKHGLEIFDVEQNNINGGSIRTYIKFKENKAISGSVRAEDRIEEILLAENEASMDSEKPYKEFANRISKIKEDLMGFLQHEKEEGKKIWIYGASTRGNVILQYFELGPEMIDFIADKNSDKWGKKTVGTLIPIISPDRIKEEMPDYLLVNTWHFLSEIMKQESEYFEKGGKFIVALPKFKVISKD